MLEWLAANKNLLVAVLGLFGAGGTGALVLQWIFRRRESAGQNQKPDRGDINIRARVSDEGTAAINTGSGSISITKNAPVSREMLESWRRRLGLSRAAASQLFEACARVGVTFEGIARLGHLLDNSQAPSAAWLALREALEANNLDRASELLRSLVNADTPEVMR
jgi:hypothetical protein